MARRSARIWGRLDRKIEAAKLSSEDACDSDAIGMRIYTCQVLWGDKILSEKRNAVHIVLCRLKRAGVYCPIPHCLGVIEDAVWHRSQEHFISDDLGSFVIPGPAADYSAQANAGSSSVTGAGRHVCTCLVLEPDSAQANAGSPSVTGAGRHVRTCLVLEPV